ncbi:MAG: long-chain fatty acid--CoA ligase, partial [Muribaculaceae bacterium]|nr:long-chain fatty acid--CoA ligase [Muribaculaceae bacterium]
MLQIKNFIKLYEKSFAENWDLPALSEFGRHNDSTYAEFATAIAKIHLLFESIGLKQGDKIALCGKDSAEWVK